MRVVKQLKTLPVKLQADVVGGVAANASDVDIIDGHGEGTLLPALFGNGALLAAVAIDAAPDKQVQVEVAFAEDGVSLDLSVVARGNLGLQAVHVDTLLGNDVDYRRQCHTAIE